MAAAGPAIEAVKIAVRATAPKADQGSRIVEVAALSRLRRRIPVVALEQRGAPRSLRLACMAGAGPALSVDL